MRSPPAATLLELLETQTQSQGERPLYTFLEDGGDDAVLSYAGLELRARRIGAALQDAGARGRARGAALPAGAGLRRGLLRLPVRGRGRRAGLPAGPDAAGAHAASAARHHPGRAARRVVLTTSFILAMAEFALRAARRSSRALHWVATDDAARGTARSAWRGPEPARGHAGLPPVHVRLHGHAQGRACSATANLLHNLGLIRRRLPACAGQRGRHLAAAVPRHGAHRRHPPAALRGLPGDADVAAGLPPAPRALAGGHLPLRRHHQRRPQLRLRPVRAKMPAGGARRGWT